jgi:uncharacterized protein (TIGR03435 family)
MKYSVAFLLACGAAFGQPAFEVASIKPAADTPGTSFFFDRGKVEVKKGTVRGIIEMAYEVRDFQISGGPAWLNSDGFDIVAKSAPDGSGIPELRRKLQTLLAERFQLKVHHETKELPVYALEVGKKGTKLKAEEVSGSNGIRSDCGALFGTAAKMATLALVLARQLGRPVEDHTALTGTYTFQVEFMPDGGACAEKLPPGRPSIFTALQEQLGLKLEPTKGPVDIIVIDRVEKPSEN